MVKALPIRSAGYKTTTAGVKPLHLFRATGYTHLICRLWNLAIDRGNHHAKRPCGWDWAMNTCAVNRWLSALAVSTWQAGWVLGRRQSPDRWPPASSRPFQLPCWRKKMKSHPPTRGIAVIKFLTTQVGRSSSLKPRLIYRHISLFAHNGKILEHWSHRLIFFGTVVKYT